MGYQMPNNPTLKLFKILVLLAGNKTDQILDSDYKGKLRIILLCLVARNGGTAVGAIIHSIAAACLCLHP